MNRTETTTPQTGTDGMNVPYQRFRPIQFRPRMSIFWWTRKRAYVQFIVRELTSVFIAAYAVILIISLYALHRGPDAWEAMTDVFETPLSIILHVIILIFAVYHSITWFLLAPTATVIKVGKKRVSDSAIITGNFLMWLVLSVTVGWILLTV